MQSANEVEANIRILSSSDQIRPELGYESWFRRPQFKTSSVESVGCSEFPYFLFFLFVDLMLGKPRGSDEENNLVVGLRQFW